MDDADRSEMDRAFLSELERPEPKNEVEATGYCLNCGAPLTDNRRWCDAECRDEYQQEIKRLKNGYV